MPSAEIVDADGEADDKEYRQRQQVRQVEIRRFRRHRFGGGGFQTASNRHRGRLKNKNENRRRVRSVFRQRFFRVVAAVAFLDDGLPADNVFAVEREGGVAVQLPAVLQGFGNAAAERGVVRSGEVAVEFHERFLQCEKHFQTASKAGRGRLKQYSEISKKQ